MAFALTLADEITRLIDEIVEEVCPGVGRRPMYGGIVFETEPGKHSTLVCGHFVYKHHVSLEFSQGAQLDDAGNVLEGKGEYRRHIKLRAPQDIRTKSVRSYIEQAFSLAQATG